MGRLASSPGSKVWNNLLQCHWWAGSRSSVRRPECEKSSGPRRLSRIRTVNSVRFFFFEASGVGRFSAPCNVYFLQYSVFSPTIHRRHGHALHTAKGLGQSCLLIISKNQAGIVPYRKVIAHCSDATQVPTSFRLPFWVMHVCTFSPSLKKQTGWERSPSDLISVRSFLRNVTEEGLVRMCSFGSAPASLLGWFVPKSNSSGAL